MDPLLAALVEAGVLPLGDAERVERELDPEAMRLHAEALLTDAFERGLTAQQRRLLAVVEQAQGQPTPRNLERLWAQENDLLWASVRDDLTSVAIDRAVGASIGAADPDTWMMVNEEVVNWVDTRYLRDDPDEVGSIPNLNRTSREMFASAFQRWQLGDRDPDNFAGGLPQLIAELQPIFGRTRAERIAVTETTRVFAQSEIFAGNANPFIEAWLYETAADDRVTPVCRSGQGRIMRKGESVFSDGMGPPPRHVRCRSSITQLTGPALAALIEDGDISGDNLPDVESLRPRAAVAVTPAPVGVPKFATVAEAQEWATARQLAKTIDYSGLTPDGANILNEEIYNVFGEKSPIRNIVTGRSGRPGVMMEISDQLDFNVYGIARNVDSVKKDLATNELGYKIATKRTNAAFLSRDYRELVIHELGHVVDFSHGKTQRLGRFWHAERIGAKQTGNLAEGKLTPAAKKEAANLSDYATTNFMEYFAEAFTAYKTGRADLVPPHIIKLIEEALP